MNIEKVEKSVENVISKEIDVEVMSFKDLTNLGYPLMNRPGFIGDRFA